VVGIPANKWLNLLGTGPALYHGNLLSQWGPPGEVLEEGEERASFESKRAETGKGRAPRFQCKKNKKREDLGGAVNSKIVVETARKIDELAKKREESYRRATF